MVIIGYILGMVIVKILLNRYDKFNDNILFEHSIIAIFWGPLLVTSILAGIIVAPFYFLDKITLGKND